MIRSVATAVTRFVNEVLFPPPTPVTHEFTRLHERCLSDRWEQWTGERGLTGLILGSATAWPLGLVLHCRMLGRLQFGDVEDRGMHIVTALGLVRARQMITDEDHFQVTAETIAIGMIGIHRKRRGSVIFVSRSDRSDRVDLWIGFHDQLAEAARQIDAEDARRTAQEAADKAKRKAERARDARMTGAMTEHIQTPTGEPLHATVADLRFHDRVPPAHTAVPEPGSPPAQRARELIAMGVRDTSALARVLESEGVRVPSSSYLRRLVREGRS